MYGKTVCLGIQDLGSQPLAFLTVCPRASCLVYLKLIFLFYEVESKTEERKKARKIMST